MAVAPSLRSYGLEETYKDVEALIYDVCHKINRLYSNLFGGLDEIVAEANILYIRAYDTFQPNHGASFTTWLRGYVWRGLLEIVRRRMNKLRLHEKVEPRNAAYTHGHFNYVDLLEALSDDAMTVVSLIVNDQPPLELKRWYRTSQSPQKALREYLTDNGWSTTRVSSTFSEITEALYS